MGKKSSCISRLIRLHDCEDGQRWVYTSGWMTVTDLSVRCSSATLSNSSSLCCGHRDRGGSWISPCTGMTVTDLSVRWSSATLSNSSSLCCGHRSSGFKYSPLLPWTPTSWSPSWDWAENEPSNANATNEQGNLSIIDQHPAKCSTLSSHNPSVSSSLVEQENL